MEDQPPSGRGGVEALANLLLDAEVVVWDAVAGRLDFAALQARMTAGRRIRNVAERRPAQLVALDVLAAGWVDVRGRPLRERRAVLEEVLVGVASPITLCQQTHDLVVAREWFRTLTAGGTEGLVIKDPAGTYPTRDGQRVWWSIKAETTLDMVVSGFTGTLAAPSTLVLTFAGPLDEAGQPVTAGSTTILIRAVARTLTPLLHPTGDTFDRTFAWGAAEPTKVTVIEPLVVEVEADASAGTGVLRRAARLHRVRPDLDPVEAARQA